MGYILKNPDNDELSWSPNLKGHDGWTIVEKDVPPPVDDATLDKQKKTWIVDDKKKKQRQRRGLLKLLEKEDFAERIEDLLAEFDARLSILEQQSNSSIRSAKREMKIIKDEELIPDTNS